MGWDECGGGTCTRFEDGVSHHVESGRWVRFRECVWKGVLILSGDLLSDGQDYTSCESPRCKSANYDRLIATLPVADGCKELVRKWDELN